MRHETKKQGKDGDRVVRILVDAYWWVDGPYSNRLVLREIVGRWRSAFPDDELVLAIPSKWSDSEAELPVGVERIPTRMRRHPTINALELPLYLKRGRDFDAIFLQNFGAPTSNAAVLVHDVLFQSNPEWFTPIERLYLSAIPFLAKRTGRVLTTTRHEADRVSTYNTISAEVAVTGLGLSTTLLEARSRQPGHPLKTRGFLLTVGRLNIRKNLENTIAAAIESGAISEDFPLVVVGQRSGRLPETSESVRSGVAAGAIVFIEFVPDEELRWLYENCALFCFLSLGEGYGLPPVEAAYFGARVLVSDIPVLRENLGACAQYVDPHDVPAISGAITALLATEAREQDDAARSNPGSPITGDWDVTVETIRTTVAELVDST
ncbi:glycosyltransferase family 4 protein [Rhodococcus wratislaviensis]|nr:glycosyltransferase family 4 protein [Rhodococcus sp. 3A]MBC2892572.1 glycosyltransferase family 4 protein [Rhodococcus sp. 4CII]